jgi:hypothetical protein
MERRNLLAGLMVLAISMFMLAGTAFAHQSTKTAAGEESATCKIKSLPNFVDQGEFSEASSVADIVEVSCNPVNAGQEVKLSDQELLSSCRGHMSWVSPTTGKFVSGPSFKVTLDNAGNANAVIFAGPGCAPGVETLVSAHLVEAPYTTVTTKFTVLPPQDTTPGLTMLNSAMVEDDVTSSVATIAQIEFPSVYAERFVNLRAEQLFARCQVKPHLVFVGPNEKIIATGKESISKIRLDNNGNAFVVIVGAASCASGDSEIEASLEQSPYTTYVSHFTVESPKVR